MDNTNDNRPLIEIMRGRAGSEVVEAFIEWLKEMEELQKSSWEIVLTEDDKIQDFLHEFEFESNNKKRSIIATRLHNSRVSQGCIEEAQTCNGFHEGNFKSQSGKTA